MSEFAETIKLVFFDIANLKQKRLEFPQNYIDNPKKFDNLIHQVKGETLKNQTQSSKHSVDYPE